MGRERLEKWGEVAANLLMLLLAAAEEPLPAGGRSAPSVRNVSLPRKVLRINPETAAAAPRLPREGI